MNTNYSVNSVPTAYITKNKQRVRQYGTTNYLKNGDEFEIELHNPLQKTILARIKLNGVEISTTGLILKPGQRVFLERYFDKPNRFKYETYDVEDSNESKNAIALNGQLDVQFFLEYEPQQSYTYPTYEPTIFWYGGTPTYGSAGTADWGKAYGGDINSYRYVNVDNTGNPINCVNYSDTSDTLMSSDISVTNSASIETGRIESGSHSNQSFITENRQFNSYFSYSSFWKILPESQRPHDMKDLKNYCSNCGTRIKKSSHKFCYNCGISLK